MAPKWLFDKITKEQAEELIMNAGGKDGRWLVRPRPTANGTGDYVLSLVFKGKPTHHLIQKRPDGVYTINKKAYGEPKTVTEAMKLLAAESPPPGWPVRLTDPCVNPNARASVRSNAGSRGGSQRGSRRGSQRAPAWMHKPMSKADADKLLLSSEPTEGKFFVRGRGPEHPGEYVLTVFYKGKPTQHLLKQPGKGKEYQVNNNVCPSCTTLGQAVKLLRAPHKFWPVPLKDHVPNGQSSNAASRPESTRASKPATPEPSAGKDTDASEDKAKEAAAAAAKAKQEAEEKAKREAEEKAKQEAEEKAKREAEEKAKAAEDKAKREAEDKARAEAAAADKARAAAAKVASALPSLAEEDDEDDFEERRRREAEQVLRQREEEERRNTGMSESARSLSEATREAAHRQTSMKRAESPDDSRRNTQPSEDSDDRPRRRELPQGEQITLKMVRKNVHTPFGFGIASLWSLQGRYNVVSDIDPNGLAAEHNLQVEDILLRIDKEDVDEEHVDRVKGLLRETKEMLQLEILRPKEGRVQEREKLIRKAHAEMGTPSTSVGAKESRKRKLKLKAQYGDCCGSLWCQHQSNLRKFQSEEQSAIDMGMQVTKRLGGRERVQMVMTSRVKSPMLDYSVI
eukprot:m.127608 g.127608  ORF g.127608 m.127608 type:complete len:627 (+) comp15805_c0_seq1:75-1955(+)